MAESLLLLGNAGPGDGCVRVEDEELDARPRLHHGSSMARGWPTGLQILILLAG